MKTYQILRNDSGDVRVVKDGFSWPALIFGVLWMSYHKLWMFFCAWILATLVLGGIDLYIAMAGENGMLRAVDYATSLASIILFLLPGFLGNDWVFSALKKRGYHEACEIEANSIKNALDLYNKRK